MESTGDKEGEETGAPQFVFQKYEPDHVAELRGCVDDKGHYYRPEKPEELDITLYTKDGRSWKAAWIPNPDALPR